MLQKSSKSEAFGVFFIVVERRWLFDDSRHHDDGAGAGRYHVSLTVENNDGHFLASECRLSGTQRFNPQQPLFLQHASKLVQFSVLAFEAIFVRNAGVS